MSFCSLANTHRTQIKPVQKQTRAGQRTRFKAVVVIGDSAGHVGLGIKTSKEVATAIRAAIIIAKLSVVPIRRGYWGTNLGEPHSLPCKQSGKCGSVTVRVRLHPFLILSQIIEEHSADLPNTAHPCPPRHGPRRLPRRKASPPTRRRRRHLHGLSRLDKNPRKHAQSNVRGRRQHVRLPDAEPVG